MNWSIFRHRSGYSLAIALLEAIAIAMLRRG
jgi:hypothetical protein